MRMYPVTVGSKTGGRVKETSASHFFVNSLFASR